MSAQSVLAVNDRQGYRKRCVQHEPREAGGTGMKTAYTTFLFMLVLGYTLPVWGDIVVFRTGACEEVKITSVAQDAVTVAGPYGEVTYPYASIYWFCPSSEEHPGLEHYWAGFTS
jgi:hypothetical protein